jgi:hypothetical protein
VVDGGVDETVFGIAPAGGDEPGFGFEAIEVGGLLCHVAVTVHRLRAPSARDPARQWALVSTGLRLRQSAAAGIDLTARAFSVPMHAAMRTAYQRE